jgi:Zn-dependent peptidase ImmA (M78 family)
LWFSFFHEAGHILLHGKRDFFIENNNMDEVKEEEANRFAADMLLPPAELQTFLSGLTPGRYPSTADIEYFAQQIGIAAGIVVGRLQHDGHVPHSHYNGLKQCLEWASEIDVQETALS